MEYFRKQMVEPELVVPGTFNKRAKISTAFIILALLVCAAGPVCGVSDGRPIDCAHSTMTVYVYKTGILAGLAHNHEVEAPIEWG